MIKLAPTADGPILSPAEFAVAETSDGSEIDLDGTALCLCSTYQCDQLMLDVPVDGWTSRGLVALSPQQVPADDILAGEMFRWLPTFFPS